MEGAIPISWNTRIAVVTGGSKGIGLEVCKQLAGSGITVVLTARDETRGTAAVEQIVRLGHSDVIFHQLDITDALSIARLTDFLKARFGKLDILANFYSSPGQSLSSLFRKIAYYYSTILLIFFPQIFFLNFWYDQ